MQTSSLYIRGKEARNRRALVLPHLEIDKILSDIPAIVKTLEARNIDLDVSQLSTKLPSLRIVKNELKRVQLEILEMAKRLDEWRSHSGDKAKTDAELKSLLDRGYATEREVKQSLYAKEEDIVPVLLKIPNFIRAPSDKVFAICKEYGAKPRFPFHPGSHVDIGGKDFIWRSHPRLCYLKNKPALLELGIAKYFSAKLQESSAVPLSGPDVVVDTLVEGCGTNPNNLDHTIAMESKLHSGGHHFHLVGASALESFAAYFTRRQVKDLPVKLYTLGRLYSPNSDALLPGLMSLTQSSRVSLFSACRDDAMTAFEEVLENIKSWYEELNIPFRMTLVQPQSLDFIDSMEVSVDVWCPSLNSYAPCGFLSLHDDFVSRRLIMVHGDKRDESDFAHTLFGCIVNIYTLVASIMENNQERDKTFTIPHPLRFC